MVLASVKIPVTTAVPAAKATITMAAEVTVEGETHGSSAATFVARSVTDITEARKRGIGMTKEMPSCFNAAGD